MIWEEGSIRVKESLIFLLVCLDVEVPLRAMSEAYEFWCKANGRRLDVIV